MEGIILTALHCIKMCHKTVWLFKVSNVLGFNSNCPRLRAFKFIVPFKDGTEGLRKHRRYSVYIQQANGLKSFGCNLP